MAGAGVKELWPESNSRLIKKCPSGLNISCLESCSQDLFLEQKSNMKVQWGWARKEGGREEERTWKEKWEEWGGARKEERDGRKKEEEGEE